MSRLLDSNSSGTADVKQVIGDLKYRLNVAKSDRTHMIGLIVEAKRERIELIEKSWVTEDEVETKIAGKLRKLVKDLKKNKYLTSTAAEDLIAEAIREAETETIKARTKVRKTLQSQLGTLAKSIQDLPKGASAEELAAIQERILALENVPDKSKANATEIAKVKRLAVFIQAELDALGKIPGASGVPPAPGALASAVESNNHNRLINQRIEDLKTDLATVKSASEGGVSGVTTTLRTMNTRVDTNATDIATATRLRNDAREQTKREYIQAIADDADRRKAAIDTKFNHLINSIDATFVRVDDAIWEAKERKDTETAQKLTKYSIDLMKQTTDLRSVKTAVNNALSKVQADANTKFNQLYEGLAGESKARSTDFNRLSKMSDDVMKFTKGVWELADAKNDNIEKYLKEQGDNVEKYIKESHTQVPQQAPQQVGAGKPGQGPPGNPEGSVFIDDGTQLIGGIYQSRQGYPTDWNFDDATKPRQTPAPNERVLVPIQKSSIEEHSNPTVSVRHGRASVQPPAEDDDMHTVGGTFHAADERYHLMRDAGSGGTTESRGGTTESRGGTTISQISRGGTTESRGGTTISQISRGGTTESRGGTTISQISRGGTTESRAGTTVAYPDSEATESRAGTTVAYTDSDATESRAGTTVAYPDDDYTASLLMPLPEESDADTLSEYSRDSDSGSDGTVSMVPVQRNDDDDGSSNRTISLFSRDSDSTVSLAGGAAVYSEQLGKQLGGIFELGTTPYQDDRVQRKNGVRKKDWQQEALEVRQGKQMTRTRKSGNDKRQKVRKRFSRSGKEF